MNSKEWKLIISDSKYKFKSLNYLLKIWGSDQDYDTGIKIDI